MREIVLDTETTGLNPFEGDKIVEIGCIELINHTTTGGKFHQYINPERSMPESAFAVHGLSEEFLYKQPVFSEIVDSFIEFIGTSNLIIHNVTFGRTINIYCRGLHSCAYVGLIHNDDGDMFC